MIDNKKDYHSIRGKFQQQPSANQMKVMKSSEKVHFQTEIFKKQRFQKPNETTTDANRKEKFKRTFILRCRHEQRLETLKGDMHRI